MLQVYIADRCPGSMVARRLAERLRERCPGVPLKLINVDDPGAAAPPEIFGTPIYAWNSRIIFLGNPSEDELMTHVRRLYESQAD